MSKLRTFKAGEGRANPVPIGALLTYQARRQPERLAVSIGDRSVTRQELEDAANRRARMLSDLGVVENDLVAIALPNSVEFHETAFAVWKLGATPAPLSAHLPAPEIKGILDVMHPRVAIGVDPSLCNCPTVPAGTNPSGDISSAPFPPLAARYQKAITSGGSTGRPKVIVDHMPASLDPDDIGLGMTLDDTILVPGPLYHNAPFGITHRALARGGHVVGMERFDAEGALALIEKYRVGWAMLAPTMMRRIFALPPEVRQKYDLSTLQMVVHMGAPCPPWLKREWIEWLGPDAIWECYGGTERMGSVCISGSDWLLHPGSVGRPDPGRVSIVDSNGNNCGPHEVGEIRFHPAPGQTSATYHYLGANSNAREGTDGYGDLGHLDADGFLYLDDRRTDMIVSGGANVYPAEVEAALESHDQVFAAAVVGLPDDDLGQRLHAIIEPRDTQRPPDPKDLERHVVAQLARYKLPYSVDFVDGRLKDDAGKMRRSQLREERVLGAIDPGRFLQFRS